MSTRFIMLSFSSALHKLEQGALDVENLSFIVSGTSFPTVEDALLEYGAYKAYGHSEEHIRLLFPKLVQPRLMYGHVCTHYFGRMREIPSEAASPDEAIEEMREWQRKNEGWYYDNNGNLMESRNGYELEF